MQDCALNPTGLGSSEAPRCHISDFTQGWSICLGSAGVRS